jgi:hypothetical protein
LLPNQAGRGGDDHRRRIDTQATAGAGEIVDRTADALADDAR